MLLLEHFFLIFLLCIDEREFGTAGKLFLLACEDGANRLYDVHNKTLVCM